MTIINTIKYNDNNNNQEWAGWRGGGEEGSKSLPPVPSLQGEDLWAFWDQVGSVVITMVMMMVVVLCEVRGKLSVISCQIGQLSVETTVSGPTISGTCKCFPGIETTVRSYSFH